MEYIESFTSKKFEFFFAQIMFLLATYGIWEYFPQFSVEKNENF
jgi:hypothetical protein